LDKKRKLPVYEKVEIIDIGAEGKAIARRNGMVIFVTKVIPGDIVDIQIRKKRKNYLEGFPVKFHKYSGKRVEPFCEHFGVCGGCKWQQLSYEDQLYYKQKQVVDNLERIGKITQGKKTEFKTILPSPNNIYYRNKLEFTFSNHKWLTKEEKDQDDKEDKSCDALGFHIPGTFDKIIDIKHCYLQKDPSNKIRLAIRDYAFQNNLSFFDLRKHEGLLRNLIIRISNTNEIMVIISFYREDEKNQEGLLKHISGIFPEITSLLYVINAKSNDTLFDLDIKTFSGRDYIFEQMEELRLRIGPKTFYQTNSEQAYQLYKLVREYAQFKGNELVYDLYTGAGTIANFIAKNSKKVIGIEYIPEAIEDAKLNSEINHIKNTSFYAGDIKDILSPGLIEKEGKPELIILDPPRSGLHKKVVQRIDFVEPDKIIYVSCSPATQARDINLLDEKFRLTKVQPVDMFPHTHHVENVVLMERR